MFCTPSIIKNIPCIRAMRIINLKRNWRIKIHATSKQFLDSFKFKKLEKTKTEERFLPP